MPMKDAVLQVRLWNEDLTGWRVLPLATRDKPGAAPGVQARITAEEGYGEGTLPLYGTLTDFEGVAIRRRVELFAVWPEGEARLYRGYIRRITPMVTDGGRLALLVKLLGRYADVARANAKKNYIKPGIGARRSSFFEDLMSRFVIAPPPGTGPPRIGGPPIFYTAATDDDTMNRLNSVRIGTSLDTLAKGGKRVARGCRVDTGSGEDQVFWLLFDDPATDDPKHILHVPGKQIGQRQREQDDTRQITELEIIGGTRQFPNLLAPYTQGNTGFESPTEPDERSANVLLNPSFEDHDGFFAPDNWTGSVISAGADKRTGSFGVQFAGAVSISQTINPPTNFPIREGDTYAVGGWARLVDAAHPANLSGALHWLDSGGSTISTYTFGPSGAGFGPLSASWRRYNGFDVAPTNATGATVVFESSNANTVILDDVFLYNASLLLSAGWKLNLAHTTGTITVNGAYEGDTWEGGYSLYVETAGSSPVAAFVPDSPDRIPLTPGEEYVLGLRYAAPSGVSAGITVEVQFYDSGGSFTSLAFATAAAATFTGWRWLEKRFVVPGGTATGQVYITFAGVGVSLIDAVMLVVSTAFPPVDAGDVPKAFWANDTYNATFRADELFDSSDPVYLAAVAVQGGVGLPGPFDSETRQEIVDDDGAETFARAVFSERTPIMERPDLETFGVIDTGVGGSTATMMPGELVRLIGPGGADILPAPLPIAEKLVRWDKGMLTITPYLQTAPADAARTIAQIVQDALQRYGSTGNTN